MDMDLGLMAKRLDHSTAGGVARGADYERKSERSRDPFALIKRLGALNAAPLGRVSRRFLSLQAQRLAPFRRNHLRRPNRIPNDVHLGRSDRG